jgi:hypothetical protein
MITRMYETREISWLAQVILALQEEHCCMELVSYMQIYIYIYTYILGIFLQVHSFSLT